MVQKDVVDLIQGLKNENYDVHQKAIDAIGKLGEKAIEPLIQALKDKNGTVREVALGTLIKIGRPAINPLIQALKDNDEDGRELTVWALREIVDRRDKRAVKTLIQALKDKSLGVRLEASKALVNIGDPAVEPLIQVLKHEDFEVRRVTIETLGEIGDNRSLEPLFQALNQAFEDYDKNNIRETAIRAIGKIKEPSIEPFILALKNNNWVVRRFAAETLGNIGDKRAIDHINKILSDEMKEVKKAAIEALEKLGHKIATMKWTLEVEKKNIDIKIDKDQFVLETPDCKIQFEISFSIAMKMLDQLRAIVTTPNIPKQSLAEEINGKTLIMSLVLGQNDHWIINLQYENDTFYAELTQSDIYRIGTVLDKYLNA